VGGGQWAVREHYRRRLSELSTAHYSLPAPIISAHNDATFRLPQLGEVRFTLTLDNLYKRLAAVVAITGMGLGLGLMIASDFIVRGIADRRMSAPREWLAAAAERFPNSARINFRLARAEIVNVAGDANFDRMAESHAGQAVNLSPWNYQARSVLATAQELNGKQAEAEKTLREAIKLAPNNGQLNWAFANLLMRRGKLSESLGPLRIAARSRIDLLPNAIDTIWRSSNGSLDALKSFAGDDSESLFAVVKFLTGQKMFAEAGDVFNSIDEHVKANSPRSADLINALMRDERFDLARATWIELMNAIRLESSPDVQTKKTPENSTENLEAGAPIWNGGFEMDEVKGLNQFNWGLRPNKFAWVSIDRSVARTGRRSLKVAFSGLDTTMLRDQVQQILVLRPGASYQLVCYAKAEELVTPEGPRVAIIGQNGQLGASGPVIADLNDWQRLTVNFVVPADQGAVIVAIVRIPKFSYDDPTRGTIWFDDFTLIER
jgi:tetratricopeptide (TPR) repeat protein